MNRIIITARIAKGLTEKEVAELLKIDESLYKEIELGISSTTSEMAETLAYYFTTDYTDIHTAIKALQKQKEIINESRDFQNTSLPASTHISIAKMGLDAIIAKQEQILLLLQIKELTTENEAIKELYEAAKSGNMFLKKSKAGDTNVTNKLSRKKS